VKTKDPNPNPSSGDPNPNPNSGDPNPNPNPNSNPNPNPDPDPDPDPNPNPNPYPNPHLSPTSVKKTKAPGCLLLPWGRDSSDSSARLASGQERMASAGYLQAGRGANQQPW
jgi:hypothetical protein